MTIGYSNRLAMVSSLYGPGTICCWLCTVVSVFVSWTFNRETRRNDKITNDFLACITLPAVAAAHLIHQIATFPAMRSTIVSTDNHTLLPRVVAIEAALNICETYEPLAWVLVTISISRLQMRRCFIGAATGTLVFGAECALFILSPRIPVHHSNFSRPCMVHEASVMIPTMIVIDGFDVMALAIWLRTSNATLERARMKESKGRRPGDPETATAMTAMPPSGF